MWSLWLERNKLTFQGVTCKITQHLGLQIISLAKFWCQSHTNDSLLKLALMLRCDGKDLIEIGTEMTLVAEEDPMSGTRSDEVVEGCTGTQEIQKD